MAQSTYTYELDEGQQNLLLLIMERGNYRKREVPYSLMSIDGDGFNCTLYEKVKHGRRKCCVQGGKAEDFVLFVLEPQVLGAATIGYEQVLDPERDKPHGGSDESGKGDYFGPLVVACCYVDEALSAQRREIGARDCKQMTDKSVLAVGSKIRHLLGPSRWAFVKIGPAAYNRLYAKIKNINRLLAWAHGVCIESLLEKQPSCPRVVVDQFAPTETVIRRPWAQFSRTSGTEMQSQGADMGSVQARFLVRSGRVAISRKDRVRYNGADYEILYVNDYGDSGEYTELMCRLLTAGG